MANQAFVDFVHGEGRMNYTATIRAFRAGELDEVGFRRVMNEMFVAGAQSLADHQAEDTSLLEDMTGMNELANKIIGSGNDFVAAYKTGDRA